MGEYSRGKLGKTRKRPVDANASFFNNTALREGMLLAGYPESRGLRSAGTRDRCIPLTELLRVKTTDANAVCKRYKSPLHCIARPRPDGETAVTFPKDAGPCVFIAYPGRPQDPTMSISTRNNVSMSGSGTLHLIENGGHGPRLNSSAASVTATYAFLEPVSQ